MNHNLLKLKGSASMEFMQKAEAMKKVNPDTLSLAGGEPDFDTPTKVCQAAKEALDKGYTHYAVGKGILPLRKRIAKKLQQENGIVCCEDDIIVTPGGKYGIYLAVNAVINPGDEVIIFTPCWVSYAPIVEACGGKAVTVTLDYEKNYVLEKEAILEKITENTKAIIINYPNNPTGKILSTAEAEMLSEIVKEYGVYIISDEIYEKITFDGMKNVSIGSMPEIRDKVITINGFSKAFAMTGWRLGYTVAVKELTDVMYKLYVHTITGTSTFIQMAATEAFDCEEDVRFMLKEYERRRNYFVNALSQLSLIHI